MEDKSKKPNRVGPPIRPSNVTLDTTKFSNLANIKPMTDVEKEPDYQNKIITKQEKVIKQPSKPKNKKKIAIIAIISSVIILALLSTFVYLAFISPNQPINIQVNFQTDLTLTPSSGITSPNQKVMPGDDLECSYILQSTTENDPDSSGLYVRLRAYAKYENNYYSNLFSYTFTDRAEWYQGADGYWYYNKVLYPNGQVLDCVRLIHLEETIGNEFSGKTVTIVLSAEVIQADKRAVEEHWSTSPPEWVEQIA